MDQLIGQVIAFAGDFAPKGWMLCDGSLLNISDHPELFYILGTKFGGDGTTTFALPDLRGRSIVGSGQGSGLTQRQVGDTGGSEETSIEVNNLPAHDHNVSAEVNLGFATNTAPGSNNFLPLTTGGNFYSNAQGVAKLNSNTIGVNEDSVGSGDNVDNMSPFQSLNYIIAVEGCFPFKQ